MATVFCRKLQCEAQALEQAPFPGELGELIVRNISAEAFEDWKEMQIKVINEYRLDLSEAEDRKTLLEQMKAFLCLDDSITSLHVGDPHNVAHESCC